MRTPAVAAVVLLSACRPAPHVVDRLEVVAASFADAQTLGLTPAQAQAALTAKLLPERGFRLEPGRPSKEGSVRVTLEVDGVREQANAAGATVLEEVEASLSLRRSTGDGDERIVVQALRTQAVQGPSLEDRQDAARRAFDLALDRLVKEARVQLDARTRSSARLQRDLRSGDPLERDAAADALVARHDRAAIPALVERLRGDDVLAVRRAMGGLVELQAREAVPELIEISRGKDPGFLRELVFALGAIGGDEAEAYLYTMAQGHDQPAVRDAARQALEEMGRHGRHVRAPTPRHSAHVPRRRAP